jgi:hypothetical protein
MNPHWNQWIAFGWLFFFVIFLGLDAAAWISGDRRIPTFSRVVTHVLPWWVVLPLCCVLFVHFLLIYAERASRSFAVADIFPVFPLIFIAKVRVFIDALLENGRVETKCLLFDDGLLAVCR